MHYNTYTVNAQLRITTHASSANDRPTLGFFALTFDDDDAPPTRTRDLELWFASSSSLRPSPTAAAFRLAAAVVGLDERDELEANESDLCSFKSASFCFVLEFLASSDGLAVVDGSGRGGRPFAFGASKWKWN